MPCYLIHISLLRRTERQWTRSRSHKRRAAVVVVDRGSSGYDGLVALAGREGLAVRFLTTGRGALRYASRGDCLVWLIGTQLQDMSGFDLHDMIRGRLTVPQCASWHNNTVSRTKSAPSRRARRCTCRNR